MANYVKGLVWTPAPVDEVRRRLHKSSAGQAVLVPVESGTVVVPVADFSNIEMMVLLKACRNAGGVAVALRWNPDERFWPECYIGAAPAWAKERVSRLARVLRVSEDVVRAYWAGMPGAANVIGLLETAGRSDVAQVARMVEAGVFYGYRDPGLVWHRIACWVVTGVLYLVLSFVASQFVWNVLDAPDWATGLVQPYLVFAAYFTAPLLIATSGIDRRFPIVPPPPAEVFRQPGVDEPGAST